MNNNSERNLLKPEYATDKAGGDGSLTPKNGGLPDTSFDINLKESSKENKKSRKTMPSKKRNKLEETKKPKGNKLRET
jgi:hypothetical protein